jgi:hypothetical protein
LVLEKFRVLGRSGEKDMKGFCNGIEIRFFYVLEFGIEIFGRLIWVLRLLDLGFFWEGFGI